MARRPKHINALLDRALAGMGGQSGEPAASREEYQQLAAAAAEMVSSSFTKDRKRKTAGLCLQYLRLSLRAPAATGERREHHERTDRV